MGKCIYCGNKAGLFRKKHKECEAKFLQGKLDFIAEIQNCLTTNIEFSQVDEKLKSICEQSLIKDTQTNDLITLGFDLAVNKMLDDGLMSVDEEVRTRKFKDYFKIDQKVLEKNGSISKVAQASILRELLNGEIPKNRLNVEGQLPFLFQKSESLIWVFFDVDYFEQKTRTEFRGGSQGVSIKIARGLYYRTSSYKGNPVQISEMKYINSGTVALTTKHLYFGSTTKSFKIPFNKIVSMEPFSDGIGLQKDGVSSKPQIFKNMEGWFVHNAISNLVNL